MYPSRTWNFSPGFLDRMVGGRGVSSAPSLAAREEGGAFISASAKLFGGAESSARRSYQQGHHVATF